MAANEEDYLDGLLKSLSDSEEAEMGPKDEEEEQIKEQVREAVEKSNEKNDKFENIYVDEDGQVNEEYVDKEIKDVMTVPRSIAAPGVDESYIVEDDDIGENESKEEDKVEEEPEIPETPAITPEEVAKKAKEKEEQEKVDESVKDAEADKEIEKLLDETDNNDAGKASLNKDDELINDMDLSEGEKDRLINMNLDDLLGDVTVDEDLDASENAVKDLLNEIGLEDDKSEEVAKEAEKEKAAETAGEGSDSKADSKEAEKISDNTDNAAKEGDAKKAAEELKEELKATKKKKSIFSIIKDIFFESLEDEDELNEEKAVKGADKAAKKAAKKAKKAKAAAKNANTQNTDSKADAVKSDSKDENQQLIDEVFKGKDNLDEPEAPKKGLIAKIKYRWEQFKLKQAKEDKEEQEQEEIERQEKQKKSEEKKAAAKEKKEKAASEKAEKKAAAKAEKAKKPKKEKKPKKVKVKEPPKPGDILKIKPKSIILFMLLIAGVIMLIQVFSYAINNTAKLSLARSYYDNDDYEKVYNNLDGISLSGGNETLYNQSKVIMYVQRQYDSYENYSKMGMNTDAINALVKGIDRYQTYRQEAKELGVEDKVTDIYNQIIEVFKNKYKLSEAEAIALNELSKRDFVTYYYKIEAYAEEAK